MSEPLDKTEHKALKWKCMCLGEGGVTGSDGISCFKGRVKEIEAICGEKLTNGNFCLSGCHWFLFESLIACVTTLIKRVCVWRLRCLSAVTYFIGGAVNLMSHPCQRQLVKCQLLKPHPLSHKPIPIDWADFAVWQMAQQFLSVWFCVHI